MAGSALGMGAAGGDGMAWCPWVGRDEPQRSAARGCCTGLAAGTHRVGRGGAVLVPRRAVLGPRRAVFVPRRAGHRRSPRLPQGRIGLPEHRRQVPDQDAHWQPDGLQCCFAGAVRPRSGGPLVPVWWDEDDPRKEGPFTGLGAPRGARPPGTAGLTCSGARMLVTMEPIARAESSRAEMTDAPNRAGRFTLRGRRRQNDRCRG